MRRASAARHSQLLRGQAGLGAVLDLDLRTPLTSADVREIEHACASAGGILVFPDQSASFTCHDHMRFASCFGEMDAHAVARGLPEAPLVLEIVREEGAHVVFGEDWHSDNSFLSETASYSFLRGTACMPRLGANDTLFSSTEDAFDALSSTMQRLLMDLSAYHSANKAYNQDSATNSFAAMSATKTMQLSDKHMPDDVLQPMVTVHPNTGRKSLFVSPTFTTRIDGMRPEESNAILQFVYEHLRKPEFHTRVSWQPHQMTMWDNRSLVHKGIADEVHERRVVQRVSVRGGKPLAAKA